MKRPTRETERMALVLMGTGPDGRQLYRPITPGALAMLNEATGQRVARTAPPAPIRPDAHRPSVPTWFLIGALVLATVLSTAVVVGLWLAVSWIFSNIALIIGLVVGGAFAARLFARPVINIFQNVRIG